MPWLSVLMPIYAGEATLARSLQSLVGQGTGIEVIAVDQASPDRSRAILESFRDRLDLTIIDAPDSRSWMQNTNIALRAAKGSIVTMLHQDDLWRPGRAAFLRGMVERMPGAALWVHGADYVDANDRLVGRISPPFGKADRLVPSDEALQRLIVQNTIALPSAAFRKDTALATGGLDEALWYTADWDLWLRLAEGGPLAWNPAVGTAYRLHSGALTLTGSRHLDDFRHQLETVLQRYSHVLEEQAKSVTRRARLSIEVNVVLAAKAHGSSKGALSTLTGCLLLGPQGACRFIVDTQLVHRVRARLRADLSSSTGS